MLSKSRSVLTLASQPDASALHALYEQRDEEGALSQCSLLIATEVYQDMGEPDQVTITIEPGDLLNED